MTRHVFHPYRKSAGPSFSLSYHVTGETGDVTFADPRAPRFGTRFTYHYELRQVGEPEPIFVGDDFTAPAEYHWRKGYIALELLGCLCLKPGDTDAEWFDGYTDRQLYFALYAAEALEAEAQARWEKAS